MDSSNRNMQCTFFDFLIKDEKIIQPTTEDISSSISIEVFDDKLLTKYNLYSLKDYELDILNFGLENTWNYLCEYILNYKNTNKFLNYSNLSELYEIGLAISDKQQKKESGQYYTPDDVALIMSTWFDKGKGINVCDVACGTGKLVLTYFDYIGRDRTLKILKNGNLYLYDLDKTALKICKTILILKYGKEYSKLIHDINCDFLDSNIKLPQNCKVISNPPYSQIKQISMNWDKTEVLLKTKELYSAFMEKIITQSKSSVIISPYSFIGGNKFYSLRKLMNDKNGFIVSFDNVPGNIFCGKKHGIFNTNTSNSVRAAITIVENLPNLKGFKLSPLIRFKNEERKNLLKTDVIERFIYDKYQIVSKKNPKYYKCEKHLGDLWTLWEQKSNKHLYNYIVQYGEYVLSMPNTCRYYTSASNGKMKRNGQITLCFNDEEVFNYVYCMINSSFVYWYWRLFDGGITYPRGLLLDMPIFYDLLSENDKKFFNKTTQEMIKNSSSFIIKKNNIGIQENIKFPRKYRDEINKKLLDILGLDIDVKIFDIVHSNMALEVNV